jgi:hypothetical protein
MGLALNPDPPNSLLPSSWDYRINYHTQLDKTSLVVAQWRKSEALERL